MTLPPHVIEAAAKALLLRKYPELANDEGWGLNGLTYADSYRADAEAIVSEALAALWQPIESAPQDGTEILVYRPSDYDPVIARWSSSEIEDPDWDGEDDFECWFSEPHGWLESDVTPTAWAPIPLPQEGKNL